MGEVSADRRLTTEKRELFRVRAAAGPAAAALAEAATEAATEAAVESGLIGGGGGGAVGLLSAEAALDRQERARARFVKATAARTNASPPPPPSLPPPWVGGQMARCPPVRAAAAKDSSWAVAQARSRAVASSSRACEDGRGKRGGWLDKALIEEPDTGDR